METGNEANKSANTSALLKPTVGPNENEPSETVRRRKNLPRPPGLEQTRRLLMAALPEVKVT